MSQASRLSANTSGSREGNGKSLRYHTSIRQVKLQETLANFTVSMAGSRT